MIAEPTERQDGLARRRCAKCDATIDEVIPRLAGDGVGVWGVVLITSVSVVVLGVAVLLIIFIKKKKNSK